MECSICLEKILEEKKVLNCNHEFHIECIDMWLKEKQECPVCRSPFLQEECLESPMENDDVRAQSLSNYENALIVTSFISITMTFIANVKNEMFFLFLIQSLFCLMYICQKVSIHLIKVMGVYIIFSFFLYRITHSAYNKPDYLLLFSIFMLEYILAACINYDRTLENI